jgi:hypothetical protein
MCDSNKENNKGVDDMMIAEHDSHKANQSDTFLRLRHKMQKQMKKNNISYKDILKMTEEAKRGE